MFLIKLHLSFSFLILITFMGFSRIFKEIIIKNGWVSVVEKKNYAAWLALFVPILNVLILCMLFVMILLPKSEVEKREIK